MSRSTAFPELTRMLAEQRFAERAAWLDGRRAVAAASASRRSWSRSDVAGGQRASAAFGLTGGELCGCHDRECRTCASKWGCGTPGCVPCETFGWREPQRSNGPRRRPEGLLDEPESAAAGWAVGEFPVAVQPVVDGHSHLFMPSLVHIDPTTPYWGETDDRISWLQGGKAYGIERMVISGMSDRDVRAPTDHHGLDDGVARATLTDPDWFVPMVRGFNTQDDTTSTHEFEKDSADYVESWLRSGFCGVGEVFVHGHKADAVDLTELLDVCALAARMGVPVQVHWEIGNIDRWLDAAGTFHEGTSAAYNYAQLVMLLSAVASREPGSTFNLILAHCGIGPAPTTYPMLPNAMADWQTRVTDLLLHYPNVCFDIAGMLSQLVDSKTTAPTTEGLFILAQIAQYSDRFLVGVDTETRSLNNTYDPITGALLVKGATEWLATVPEYRSFLSSTYAATAGIDPAERAMVLRENARRLFGV